jgi:nucleoside-diphosphate-sugar epimerase
MEYTATKLTRVLLTGSTGFIGSRLSAALEQAGYTLIRADRTNGIDLVDPICVNNLPDVDIVVHLAALTTQSYIQPADVLRTNLLSTQYLIDRYAGKIQRFVLASTSETYASTVTLFDWPVPTCETVPLSVEDVTNPRWSYAASKIANELQVTAAHKQLGMDYTIIRYHNTYGPGQKNQFIPDFIQRAKAGNLLLNGWDSTRSFMYVDDVVDATIKIIQESKCINEIINVGSEDERNIKELAELILDQMGVVGELTLVPSPPGSVLRRCADLSKMKSLIDFVPRVSLEQGIAKILDQH